MELEYSNKVNYYLFLGRKIDQLNKRAEIVKSDKDKLNKIYQETDRLTDLQRKTNSEIEQLQRNMPRFAWYYSCS